MNNLRERDGVSLDRDRGRHTAPVKCPRCGRTRALHAQPQAGTTLATLDQVISKHALSARAVLLLLYLCLATRPPRPRAVKNEDFEERNENANAACVCVCGRLIRISLAYGSHGLYDERS